MENNISEITTENFLLRKFTESDLENVHRGLSNKEVIKYYGISFKTLEATKEQINWFSEIESNGTGIWWAICSLDNKKFYGAGGFSSMNKKFKKAEIGFWLLPEYWRNGIMSQTFPLLCKYGFNNLGLHRIEGFVESENIACRNAMSKLNFNMKEL
jgi:ribosomal-protein-alanine N-acetyltransferase